MSILHWFPGHMHKAQKELKLIINQVDVVFEIVDARAPESSRNPLLEEIIQGKPIITILSKADLADKQELKSYIKKHQHTSIALNILQDSQAINKLEKLAHKKAPNRNKILKPTRAVIVGIPNVGKSSLINKILGRKITKTGNEPAVTKRQQIIQISDTFTLRDTPGIMAPRPKDEHSAYALAICGAIRDTAMDYPTAAYYLIDYLIKYYPNILKNRYKIDESIDDPEIILIEIGKYIGAIKANNEINEHQIAEKLILDFRQGRLGGISLDTYNNAKINKLKKEI